MEPSAARDVISHALRIEGWFEPEAGMLFAFVDSLQRGAGIHGDIVEIGVHHGRSSILLAAMLDPARERLKVCDLFDAQEANVSRSGRGDREIFEANVGRILPGLSVVDVLEMPSSELTPQQLGQNCRFFHVDGGHSAGETAHDLDLAAAALLPEGIIALDDAFNAVWPTVTEGLWAFLGNGGRAYAPLCVGFNKLLLCRRQHHGEYAAAIGNETELYRFISRALYRTRTVRLSGTETHLIYPGPRPPALSLRGLRVRGLSTAEWLRQRWPGVDNRLTRGLAAPVRAAWRGSQPNTEA